MLYGFYLSATGVLASTYRQDVIANNIANSETIGFKRDLAMFQERRTAAQETGGAGAQSDPNLERIGGGMLAAPTLVDDSQGDMEPTGNPMDVAIQGKGYFGVNAGDQFRLTRNGQFVIDHTGRVCLMHDGGPTVLDANQTPIQLDPTKPATIADNGAITQAGKVVAHLGVFDVADASKLKKEGNALFSVPNGTATASSTTLRTESLERSNVDPATELTELMDTQRQLEANANMIKCQDDTLSKLVSDVGKIS